MSTFDNPFADNSDPFADPSVQQARGGAAASGQPAQRPAATDEFNPFDKPATKPASQPAVLPSSQPQQPQPPPPAYSASAQQRVTSEELERRQRELEAKARELERREEEQRKREQEMQSGSGYRNNNWPPLPSFCPVGPCFYQDFELEIPQEFRRIVKLGYYLWMAHVAVLLINVLGTLAYFIGAQSNDASAAGAVFGVSLLLCIVLPPCSFVCWFRPLYKAFKNDSSFNFFLFFLVFFVQFCILVVQCLGFNYLGSCGWINGTTMLHSNVGAAGFMLFIAASFTCLAVFDIILLIRVHRIYRSTGASFAKAKQEFSQGVLTNEAVRGVAADAATASARSAFTGGGGRY